MLLEAINELKKFYNTFELTFEGGFWYFKSGSRCIRSQKLDDVIPRVTRGDKWYSFKKSHWKVRAKRVYAGLSGDFSFAGFLMRRELENKYLWANGAFIGEANSGDWIVVTNGRVFTMPDHLFKELYNVRRPTSNG